MKRSGVQDAGWGDSPDFSRATTRRNTHPQSLAPSPNHQLEGMDDIAPVVFPAISSAGLPQVPDVPALVDLGALRAIDLANEAARQRQRGQHFRTNAGEGLFILHPIELVRAVGIVLTEAGNEVQFLSRLVLRRVPVIDAPEDAHPAEVALEINVLDLSTDDLLGVEGAQPPPPVLEDLEVVMESIVLRIAAGSRVGNRLGQAQHLAPGAVVG